jgi:carbon-monoxide dehydrogenase medium subunit
MLEAGAYARATSLAEASELLDEDSCIYAGGTFLLQTAAVADRRIGRLVDVKSIPELSALYETADGIRVGAATTHHALASSALVRKRIPMLAAAAAAIASRQVRNRATIGGNLCAAEPAFDLPTPLIAAGASVRIWGSAGFRELTVEKFIPRYGGADRRADEVLESVWIPVAPPTRGSYVRCVRSSFESPLVGAAVSVDLDASERCNSVRVVLGNFTTGPIRCSEAEAVLRGSVPDREAISSAAAAAVTSAPAPVDVRASAGARRRLAQWAVGEALRQAIGDVAVAES